MEASGINPRGSSGIFIQFGYQSILIYFKEPRNAQSTFSSETEPTLWRAIPILECIQTNWTTFSKLDKFKPLHTAIQKGLKKLEKWYTNIKQSDSYYTCLGLPFHSLSV